MQFTFPEHRHNPHKLLEAIDNALSVMITSCKSSFSKETGQVICSKKR